MSLLSVLFLLFLFIPGVPTAIRQPLREYSGDHSEDDQARVCDSSVRYDYVRPHLITLFVTSNGGVQPSYIYRILQENYHRDDYIL